MSVRTTGGEGDRRVTRSLRKWSTMEKHEAMGQGLERQVQGEQEVVDKPRLEGASTFAWVELGINIKAKEAVNQGQLRSCAICLS